MAGNEVLQRSYGKGKSCQASKEVLQAVLWEREGERRLENLGKALTLVMAKLQGSETLSSRAAGS